MECWRLAAVGKTGAEGVVGARASSTSEGSSSTENCSPRCGSCLPVRVDVLLIVAGFRGLVVCGDKGGRAEVASGPSSDRLELRGLWALVAWVLLSVPIALSGPFPRGSYAILTIVSPNGAISSSRFVILLRLAALHRFHVRSVNGRHLGEGSQCSWTVWGSFRPLYRFVGSVLSESGWVSESSRHPGGSMPGKDRLAHQRDTAHKTQDAVSDDVEGWTGRNNRWGSEGKLWTYVDSGERGDNKCTKQVRESVSVRQRQHVKRCTCSR